MAASRNKASPDVRLTGAVAGVLATARVAHGQRLCVALSGGADSISLLHVLTRLRNRVGFELCAAHVNHGLSPNADAWASFCADQCNILGVPLQSFCECVRRDHPDGLEAAARERRHAALASVSCDWLVFGHHADDQAETLLFRLVRGAGVRGAGAMSAVDSGSPGRLRPLLTVRRAEIETYARAHGLAWVEDESNADVRYARNFLRHRVLPALEEAFPGSVPALGRAAAHFRDSGKLLDDLAALDSAACGGTVLDRSSLLALSDERVRNVLRWRIYCAGVLAPDRSRLDEAVRQLRDVSSDHPLFLSLGALACCVYRGQVWLEPTVGTVPEPIVWRGESELPWGCGAVRFEAVTGEGLSRAALEAAGEVLLATRWVGLAMRQAAGRPTRSFKNLCQEAGIPSWLRDRLPVLRVDDQAAWLGELGEAADFRCGTGEPGVLPVWRR